MDPWLTDQVKELLFRPCLAVSGYIGRRLNNRLQVGQEIDERALTEDLVDRFDTSSGASAWGFECGTSRVSDIPLDVCSQVNSGASHRGGYRIRS
jgi:hypothetical protein